MSDLKSHASFKPRRSKIYTVQNINNNNINNIKGFYSRRRSRGNRNKSVRFNVSLEMTGSSGGKEGEKDEFPRLSPVLEDKICTMKPERQYSREELIELMTHPLSSMKHPCLESPQNKSLVSGRTAVRWAEDRWDHSKRNDSLTDEDKSDGSLEPQKKRMNDPKAERLRKEQEVVLSPQRRSFNSGCFVNLSSQHVNSANRRPESPSKGERETSHRDIPSRRIGSGRIMRDPVWDYRGGDKDEGTGQNVNTHDFNYRQRDERFERRSFERSHDKERSQPRSSRYNNNNERKKHEKNEPEEPEWFSGGPTSQHDTIELHGFDGLDEKITTNKKQNKSNKSNSKNNRKVSETINNKNDTSNGRKSASRKSSPEVIQQPRLSSPPMEDKQTELSEPQIQVRESSPNEILPEKTPTDPDCLFDFEDILNFDSLPLLSITNGCVDEGGSGSRFSQFFHRDSPSPQHTQNQNSRVSSTHDDMFHSIINDITETTKIGIPPDGNTYFAPISPAAPSLKEEVNKGPSANLLEMLQRGSQGYQGRKITKKPSLKDLEASGKIHSVEELEARLRQEQGIGKPAEYPNRPSNKEEELAGFRKLMMGKQVQNVQDPKPLSHSSVGSGFQNQQHSMNQQQQQQHSMNQHQQHSINQQQQHSMNQQQQQQMPIPHDFVMKLLHVQQQQRQQEVFAKLLTSPTRLAPTSQYSIPPPLSPELQLHISNTQPSKELLQRPEAQTILRSLKRGEITVLHLLEQLKRSTNMQPIHREMIASIIKLHGLQSNISHREPSPATLAPPSTTEQLLHQMLHNQQSQQQQQQLRIPSPHPNVLQRVPSPRELVVHTQNILQNALLKKKLEEQKENFRKRQELQRSHSPNVSVGGHGSLSPANHQQPNTTSPTPLAFTPTSVLRKMTADKESEFSNKLHQQADTSQQPTKQESIVHANGIQPSEKPFRQLPNTWNLLKPIQGRAIVKGNNNFSIPPAVVTPNVDYMSMPPQFKSLQHNKLPQSNNTQQQQFLMGMNRNNVQPPSARVHGMGGSNMLSQQQQGMTQSVQQLLMNHSYNNPQQRNNTLLKPECQPMIRGQGQVSLASRNYNMAYQNCQEGTHDLSVSPVSNQLARWFSPELLAQARAGKLPDMPPISPTQNMLSVEELERLQQAVHN